ncbi:hypothetical protein D0Z07_8644 [Hyphodiscus hymeniophilus]|uniref:Telomere-associated protein Rif1 N-terminal domain-containing protein n=1 Tax=Hyphodiscus hymeniophilus TaxID=353542 RepID=A0A9P6SKB1_9HELO|nr:hypothetical protein D0Z07_8644 [Hyphodiscus hymeniophilus]
MMVQSAPVSRTVPTARPPTPPRESNANSKPPNLFSRLFTRTADSQADITPTSSSELPNQAEQSRKKVAWDDSNDTLEASAQPTSPERRPIKSILKPYNGKSINLGPTKLSPPHTYANLAAMLESVAQQLAGSDRDSKLDAYTTLSGVLKASENVPDVRALKEKMVLLLAFIKRDLTEKTSTGALDTTLAVNALILLSIFLHRSVIADSITTDFSSYLVDHAIKTFQDGSMSKDVAKHLMLVLAEQKFSHKVMTGDRVSKVVASLHDIENYVKGKSIVMGRISIYRNLLRQSKAHMMINTDWMPDLFGDLFSTVKDTKTAAISFGFEAALTYGTDSKASRVFMELFSADLDDNGVKFGKYYIGRLEAMIESKHDMASVPQIWSIVILFLRSKSRQFEQWAFMNPWLGIVQQCFNCSDQQTKLEANLAWNRLVYAIQPDEKTPPQMIKLLYQPLDKQLKRKSKGKKTALGSLCNLLYYALKPTSNSVQLDLYWDRYIVEAIGKALNPPIIPESTLELVRQDSKDACRILAGLFDSTTPRKWSETRAVEAFGKETLMDATELPSLDSKWLRRSASRVFPIIGPLLEKLYWDLAEDNEAITTLWKAYVTSIASPAIMEVKVSNETMSCVACIFGLLYKIWQIGPKSLRLFPPFEGTLSADFLLSFETITSTTIRSLGLLPFTEKLLSVGHKDEFVVIATPSHQPKMARGEPRCPLHHFMVLLTTVSPDLEYDRNFSRLVQRTLEPFLDARPSKRAKVELILDLLGLLPPTSNEPCRMIWSVLADIATSVTATRDNANNGVGGMSDQPLGSEYRKTLRILEIGLDLSPTEPLPGWKTLFEALVTSATIDAGESGRAIAVIEPLGRILQLKFSKIDGHSNSRSHIYFRTVLSKVAYPKDRQAFDAARRKLWGTAAAKTSSFDPYSLLYDYMRESLGKAYTSFENGLSLEYSDIITATTSLLSHCPTILLTGTLVKLQNGIASWIKDEGSHLGGGTPLSQSITSLWSKICQILPNLIRVSNSSRLLADLEILLCSGLESRHRSIVNSTIRLWNSTFGASKVPLEYPETIKGALLNIHRVTELQLPFFPESLESDGLVDQRQLTNFADTQGDLSNIKGLTSLDSVLRVEPATRVGKISPMSSARLLRSYTPQVLVEVAQSVPHKRSRESTPDSNTRKSRQRSVLPKLRHDDSQVQFEAIDSSPINGAVLDSQLLTDRQKEVKERQQAEAAMFPDLRSSPRQKEKSRASFNSELPLHRSASKSRGQASPTHERETTPSLAPHVEFDDFLNSSPTPTRSLHNDSVLPEPPSSPPEAPKELIATYREDEMDIPSSPPEIPNGTEMDTKMETTTTPFGSSAQNDPYAGGVMPTLSTFEITLDQQNGPSTFKDPGQPESLKPAVTDETSIYDAQSSSNPRKPEIEAPVRIAPDTPTRGRESSQALFQTPRSELFHDAQTSPASSDKVTVNEDVFEDAVSSPRLELVKVKEVNKQLQSSPISYLDESSALRMMIDYDQGSGRPRRSPRNVRFGEEKDNEIVSAQASSSDVLQTSPEDSGPLPEPQSAQGIIGEPAPSDHQSAKSSSPLPSLIPETPGSKTDTSLQVVDGEEIDLEETIVVDDSILQEQQASASKRRKRKSDMTSDANASPASKKGRHEELVKESRHIADNQDANPESKWCSLSLSSTTNSSAVISPKKATAPKKRRGRPKRGTNVSSSTGDGSQPNASVSSSSANLEGSADDAQEMDIPAEVAISTANEPVTFGDDVAVEESLEIVVTTEDYPISNEAEMEVATMQSGERKPEDQDNMSVALVHGDQHTSDLDVVVDTMIGETSLLDNPSSAGSTSEKIQEEVVMSASKIMTMSSEPVDQSLSVHVDVSMQTEIIVESLSFEGMKGKLQSLISDLGAVSLRREEMNELEDLFMDAKQLLYGAGRRGRAGS